LPSFSPGKNSNRDSEIQIRYEILAPDR